MGECLVTQLRGVVEDTSLLKLNEMALKFERTQYADGITQVKISSLEPQTLKIQGDGNFVTEAGAVIGKSQSFPGGQIAFFIDSSVREVRVSDKKAISQLGRSGQASTGTGNIVYRVGGGDLPPVTLCNALRDFRYLPNLVYMACTYTNLYGDLNYLNKSVSLANCYIAGSKISGLPNTLAKFGLMANFSASGSQIRGALTSVAGLSRLSSIDFSDCNVSGNVSVFSTLTTLTYLHLGNTSMIGSFASLAPLTSITNLNVSGTAISGSVEALAPLTALTTLDIRRIAVSGDLAKLAPSVRYIDGRDANSTLTWSAKGGRTDILFTNRVKIISGADQFLIDMATCNVNPISSANQYKTISILANVTSASASAISTLQSKGVTVTIEPII